jgi:hypothetical protein
VLRRIFGQKRDVVTGGWRKLHNEEFHNLYSSPSIIRIMCHNRGGFPNYLSESYLLQKDSPP